MQSKTEHGVAVDYWSFGVLLFEMLSGDLPYYHRHLGKMREMIQQAKPPKFPKFLTAAAIGLMKALIQKDPAKRLPVRPDGKAGFLVPKQCLSSLKPCLSFRSAGCRVPRP